MAREGQRRSGRSTAGYGLYFLMGIFFMGAPPLRG
jgi:hypothetical protein